MCFEAACCRNTFYTLRHVPRRRRLTLESPRKSTLSACCTVWFGPSQECAVCHRRLKVMPVWPRISLPSACYTVWFGASYNGFGLGDKRQCPHEHLCSCLHGMLPILVICACLCAVCIVFCLGPIYTSGQCCRNGCISLWNLVGQIEGRKESVHIMSQTYEATTSSVPLETTGCVQKVLKHTEPQVC